MFGADVAVFDLTATALGGYYLSRMLGISPIIGIPATFAIGQATHRALGIKTAFSNPETSGTLQHSEVLLAKR